MVKSSNRDQNKNLRFQNNNSIYISKGSSCHQQFCNSRACASNSKKTIYKKHSKCNNSRKTSLLHSSLGKNYSGSRNVIYCKGVRNTVCKSPISEENTKLHKNVKRTIFISGTGSFGNVGERNYPKSNTHTRAISEQPLQEKKYGGSCTVVNFKNLNKFIPYKRFKMEGLHYLKFVLDQDNLLCKLDLKEAYFLVLINKNSQNFVRFQWSGNLYEFLCLCFGLESVPRNFTKLLKVPIALLRHVNIRIIIYLDDMLLNGRTLPEILVARDTLIFLLQHLGFMINFKKLLLRPVKQIEFLGLVIDTKKMTFALSEKQSKCRSQQCHEIFKQPKTVLISQS